MTTFTFTVGKRKSHGFQIGLERRDLFFTFSGGALRLGDGLLLRFQIVSKQVHRATRAVDIGRLRFFRLAHLFELYRQFLLGFGGATLAIRGARAAAQPIV